MKKFLFFTDVHLSGVNPRHRIDDFPHAVTDKLREVYSIAETSGCEFVVFGGDFFNSHRIFSYELISEAMDIICGSKIPTYAIIGQHDLFGHSPNTYASSTLSFFARHCSQFRVLHEGIDFGDIVLWPCHVWEDIKEAMNNDVDKTKINVLICHGLLTNQKAAFDIIDTASLTPCPYDLVLSGDLHTGYETHEVNGVWFCNPGAITRRAISEIDRVPQVAVIEIEKDNVPIIDIRRLCSAKPGCEVFGEGLAEIARLPEGFDGSVFADEMMEFEAESVNIHELIEKVGVKKGVRKEVLDYLSTKGRQKEP